MTTNISGTTWMLCAPAPNAPCQTPIQTPGQSPQQQPPHVPGTTPPAQSPKPDPAPWMPPTPPPNPPTLPPDDSDQPTTPTDPTKPTDPSKPTDPTEPPTVPPGSEPGEPDQGGGRSKLLPWIAGGAGAIAVGALGYLALKDGARNVRALRATTAAFESGAMYQGGLRAIEDASLGAKFASGIGTGDYVRVSLPGVNRIGTGGALTSVARGHLDHAELLASATALRRGAGDAVSVHEPLRKHVLHNLESGTGLSTILDDLDRSAAGARPYFTNPRLMNYWDQASIVESGSRRSTTQVLSATTREVPELAIRDRAIVETGATARVDSMVARRGASLGHTGLADGIGSIQSANVATLPPALRDRALAASRIDPARADEIGLQGAFVERWQQRLA